MATSCSFEDVNGAILWSRLEALLSPQQNSHGCRRILFDVVQRLKSKRYETVLNTFTVTFPSLLCVVAISLQSIVTFTVDEEHAHVHLFDAIRAPFAQRPTQLLPCGLSNESLCPAVASHLQCECIDGRPEAFGKRSHLQCLCRTSERQE